MKRVSLLFLVIILTFSGISYGQEIGSTSFLQFGAGARALGMGGAFVALADNYSASVWNPAGFATIKGKTIGGMYYKLFGISGLNFNFLSGVMEFNTVSLAGTYTGFVTTYRATQEGGVEKLLDYREEVFMGSAAYNFKSIGLVGGSIKKYAFKAPQGGVDGETAFAEGIGLDFGILKPLSPKLRLGFAVFDFGGTSIQWRNTPAEPVNQISPIIKAGLSYSLDKLTISGEYDLMNEIAGGYVVRWGCEAKPTPNLAIRVGTVKPKNYGLYYTFGMGITIKRVRANFAWVQNRTQLGQIPAAEDTIVLSAEFPF